MIRKSLSFLLLGLCIIIGLDQAIKYWVMHTIPLETEISLLPFVSLYHVHNSGIAFSFLSSFHYMGIIALTLIIILFLLYLWKNTKHTKILSRFGIVLIIGGALGNLIDRIRFHYVIDYILFYIDGVFSFAIFNLADASITFGTIAIMADELYILIKGRRRLKNIFSESE
ncbi:signal peptidase II [Bartonella sp. A05]|uniref:signal peptidase II n=1 Tax=Bartonella sp. A05 TaxID=2967261 RepID=UPI0022A9E55D|nr:signal peptidase II [Bartonella sp. A05]MCZ2203505.1 signal peptidase II [Bartonella sp. A05]